MANVKISQLPVTGTPSTLGLIPIVQDGTTYSTTAEDLVALAAGGVTSFNTRAGAVTLADTDVTGALGYTPVSPTTLATNLADYVPETRTITINGDTQDLSANQTWNIGTVPVTLQGTNSIAIGDFVKVNEDGTVSNAKPVPLVSNTFEIPSTTTNFFSWGNVGSNLFQTTSNPVNPNKVVNLFIDTNASNLLAFTTNVNEGSVDFEANTPALTTVAGGCIGFITEWDPFEEDVLWVLSNYYNSFYNVYKLKIGPNNTIIILYTSTIAISTGSNIMINFKLSNVTPNLMTVVYYTGSALNAVNVLFTITSFNTFTTNVGMTLVLDGINTIQVPNVNVWDFVRISDVDDYAVGYTHYNGVTYTSVLLTFSSLPYSGGVVVPNIVLNDTETVYQTTEGVAYSTYKNLVSVDKNKLVYSVLTLDQVTPGSLYLNSFKVVQLNGTTIGTIGTEFVYTGVISGATLPNQLYTFPINKNYLLFFGINDLLGYSGGYWGAVMKVNSDNTISVLNLDFALGATNGSMSQFSTLVTFNLSNNGTAFLNAIYANSSNSFTIQTSPIIYIDKQFNNQNLLGTAATSITLPAAPPVIGQPYQGGTLAYVLEPGDIGYNPAIIQGYVAADVDQSSGIQWYNGSYIDTGATGIVLGTGSANTNLITSVQGAVETNYAAGLAKAYTGGGYNDWYLPSINELSKLYLAKNYLGTFTTVNYWSSTESNTNNAQVLTITDGSTNPTVDKSYSSMGVRAIRSFSFTPSSSAVDVLPFTGGIETKAGVVAGNTYYIQDDAALTTNVTPSLYGTAISSSSVKTANYPTI